MAYGQAIFDLWKANKGRTPAASAIDSDDEDELAAIPINWQAYMLAARRASFDEANFQQLAEDLGMPADKFIG